MLKKTDDTSFMRDESNQALINTNVAAYKAFKQQRQQVTEFSKLQDDVHTLKSELGDIKQLLGQLIENVSINNKR